MSDKGQLTWEILKDQLKKVRKDNWNKDRIIKEQETALAEHGMEIESLTAKLQAAEEREARLREALEEIIEDANCECFYATPNPKLIVCPPCIARAALEVKP